MEIPWQSMDSDTLDRLLSELVTRDGTDYGRREHSTAEKVAAARCSLEKGRACLMWDSESETAALVPLEQIREEQQQYKKDALAAGLQPGGEKEIAD